MTGNRYDCGGARLVAASPITCLDPARDRRCRSFCRWLCLVTLLGAVPSLQAQHWTANSANLPQKSSTLYGSAGYPQGYGQPIPQAQNYNYGSYQNGSIPASAYPQTYSPPNNYTPAYAYPRAYTPPNNYTPAYAYPRTSSPPSNSGYAYTPSYAYPRAYPTPNNTGVYQKVNNPNGATGYSTAVPNRPAVASRVPVQAPVWTEPAPPVERYIPGGPFIDDGGNPNGTFQRPNRERFWVKAEYLAAFIRPMSYAYPLATLGVPGQNGAVGQVSTTAVYGQDELDYNFISGARLEGGLYLDCENRFSIDMSGFFLLPEAKDFSISTEGGGNPLISRPLLDPRNNFIVTSSPGLLSGTLTVENTAEMGGLELNARYHSYPQERVHVEALAGLRYVRLAESLRIQDKLTPLANGFLQFNGLPVDPPSTLVDSDSFRTVNQFFGPQIGGRVRWEHSWFTFDGFAKMALGLSGQRTTIDGSTTAFLPNGKQTAAGGILAVPSNIGTHTRHVVGFIPEVGANLGVDLSRHVRLQLGYSLLMWSGVVRPGSQYDPNVNLGQVPGSQFFGQLGGRPATPTYRFSEEFLWTHTFNFGLAIRY